MLCDQCNNRDSSSSRTIHSSSLLSLSRRPNRRFTLRQPWDSRVTSNSNLGPGRSNPLPNTHPQTVLSSSSNNNRPV